MLILHASKKQMGEGKGKMIHTLVKSAKKLKEKKRMRKVVNRLIETLPKMKVG